jgi:hypothetical protein
MNEEARKHMDRALLSLQDVRQCLSIASGNAENSSVKEKIDREISHVDSCLQDCEGIVSGLSQK